VEEIEINAFAGLQMMRKIDLSYNKLQSFNPKIFSSNPVLEYVSLQGNNLVYISSDFPILISASILSLDLSSCSLTAVHPVTFSSLPSLYDLDLSSNNLRTLSLRTLENLTHLKVLKLNNNRWKCNCDIVEVMKWAELRMEQHATHKPVRCWEGKQYRTLWTVAGGNRSCSGSKTTEQVVTSDRNFTTDMALNLTFMSMINAPFLETSPATTLQRVIENAVNREAELGTATESKTADWDSLLYRNISIVKVFLIMLITLAGPVLVYLVAVHYVRKRCKDNRDQNHLKHPEDSYDERTNNAQETKCCVQRPLLDNNNNNNN
jgi:hypothetical protein